MKNKLMKSIVAGIVTFMMTTSLVLGAASVTNKVTVVEKNVTVTTSTGTVVENAVLTVVPTYEVEVGSEGDEKKNTVMVNNIPETAKKQVETLNTAIDDAVKAEKPEKFTEVILEMVAEKQIELVDENDTFKVENMKPLTSVHDVVLMDEDGNVIEDVKDVDVKIEVQSLVEGMGEVRIMHFDVELEKWIIIKPEVNFEEKTLEFHLDHAGPIMVVYEAAK